MVEQFSDHIRVILNQNYFQYNSKVWSTRHWYALFLNTGLHAGIHAENDR